MKNTKKWFALLLVFAMIFALAACNANKPDDGQKEDENQPVPDDREITVTDMSGDEVTIKGKVEKIVNLWPGGTTSFFVMGAGDLITGLSTNNPATMTAWAKLFYPKCVDIPALGGISPAVEELVNLEPDLVIIHPSTAKDGMAQQIRDVGIPAVNLSFSNYDQMAKAYSILGKILGGEYETKLNKWCEDVVAKSEHIKSLTADAEKPVVFYLTGHQESVTTTMGANSIIGEWIDTAGGTYMMSLVQEPNSGEVTEEEIFKMNPDIIIIGGLSQHAIYDIITTKDGWKDLDAVKNGKVYTNPFGCYNWERFGLESLMQLDYALYRIQPEIAEKEGITEDSLKQEIIDFYKYYNGTELTTEQAGYMLQGLSPDGTVEGN